MAHKSLVLLAALLLLAAAVGPAVGLTPSLLGTSNPLAVISGVVPCSLGSSINVAAVPPFANANVQGVCGSTVVANVTTDVSGAFVINLGSVSNLIPEVLSSLLSGQCRVVVVTPLVACNVSLAGTTGTLGAPLQLLGGNTSTGGVFATIFGILVPITNGILNLVTGLFSFSQTLG